MSKEYPCIYFEEDGLCRKFTDGIGKVYCAMGPCPHQKESNADKFRAKSDEELAAVIDPNLSAYDKLLFLNHELFYMIETSIDIKLLAYLYSSQLITKDKKSLSDQKRFYFKWVTEILAEGLKNGEFKNTSTAEELMDIYAMYERAVLYDWALFKGKYSLSEYSDRLLPHVLDTFVDGI